MNAVSNLSETILDVLVYWIQVTKSQLRELSTKGESSFHQQSIHPSMLEVLTLPTGRSPSGSTANIFSRMCTIREGLADLYCAKALYAGIRPVVEAPDGSFRIHVAPFHGKLPVIKRAYTTAARGRPYSLY
jgi:hypothetical protein